MIKALILLAGFVVGNPALVTYNLDVNESLVEWKGSKIVGNSHTGTLKFSEGAIEMDGDKLVSASFVVDMTSLNNTDLSGGSKTKLEGHLKSDDFFGVENYKTSKLVFTKAVKQSNGTYKVKGELTVKGKTETIDFPAVIQIADGKLLGTAALEFDRSKFDVRYGSDSFFDNLGDNAISNTIELNVKIVANL